MTLIGIWGFDETGEVPWTGDTPRATGRVGGQCQQINGQFALGTMAASYSQFVLGFAYKYTAAGTLTFLYLSEASGPNHHFLFNMDSSGHLVCTQGNGTTLGTSTLALPAAGTWFYIEIKAVIADGTGGSVVVHVDGTTYLNITGVDTRNGGTLGRFDRIYVDRNTGSTTYMDDMYVVDTSTGSPNDFLGDVVVSTQIADGNGASSQWTNSGGNTTNNYTYVDDPGSSLNTTDYVGASTSGLVDLYTVADLTQTSGTVIAVQVQVYAGKSDAGTPPTMKATLKATGTGTVQTETTTLPLSTTYQLDNGDLHLTDPDGAAWSIAKVNGLQVGVTSG